MTIETIPTADLIPYARNSRTHSPEQVVQIAGSIREFGFTNPVLIDAENGIIAGHGRVMAAQKLGLASVPCIRLAHLTDAQRRAYIIADNKLALNAGWDDEMLRLEFEDLKLEGFDLSLTGFNEAELAEIAVDLDDNGAGLSDDYTQKVDVPIYEPKGEKPSIDELINAEKAEDFLSKIQASSVPDDVKAFLKKASSRHLIFDYGKIAEFYCHADKETQLLMEDLALVIIDFKKALQLGYVKLKSEIADALESEQGGADDDE